MLSWTSLSCAVRSLKQEADTPSTWLQAQPSQRLERALRPRWGSRLRRTIASAAWTRLRHLAQRRASSQSSPARPWPQTEPGQTRTRARLAGGVDVVDRQVRTRCRKHQNSKHNHSRAQWSDERETELFPISMTNPHALLAKAEKRYVHGVMIDRLVDNRKDEVSTQVWISGSP